ncbi:MAG TPA: NAD-dependent epimerase/dehydratase family protein [Thermoanaerobaculia bacterium]|jgi:UDP-glucose 4-epimerase|nr:NAD-dependent epimerase/dehydratase family protein [Thermoanaerobaculia bacterium]
MSETLLITGGAGFIGSHLADDALRAGHRVIVLDNLSTGRRENVPAGAELVVRDLRDEGLEELLRDRRVTVVSHHAAQANVRVSVEQPLLDAEANVLGGLELIQACRHTGVRRILFASSGGTVYGEQVAFPCDENHPTRPLSPYGCSKLAVEQYLLAYGRLGDLEPLIVRYANVYGPRQDPKGEAGIVAIFAEHLLRGEPPRIFGDGLQTRDYVHVSDIAAVQRAALEHWQSGIFNVGTGIETTLRSLYSKVVHALGLDIVEPLYMPENRGELRRSALSHRRLAETLGVAPTVELDAGLADTLPYYRRKQRQATQETA